MYRIVEKIEDVRSYALDEEYLYLSLIKNGKNGKHEVIEYYSRDILIPDVSLSEFRNSGKDVFISDFDGACYYISNKKVLHFNFPILYLEKDVMISRTKINDDERGTLVTNYRTKEILGKIDSFEMIVLIHDHYFFRAVNDIARKDVSSFDRTIIECYTFPACKPLWNFDLSQLGDYKNRHTGKKTPYTAHRFIGVIGNELFVALNNFMILVLNKDTGEETRRFQTFKSTDPKYFGDSDIALIGTSYYYKISQDRSYLYSISFRFFIKIDIETNEITLINLTESLIKNQLRSIDPSPRYLEIEKHYLVYAITDSRLTGTDDDCGGIAAINKKTLQIDWFYTDGALAIKNIQRKDNKLFIHTKTFKLNIFEETEDALL